MCFTLTKMWGFYTCKIHMWKFYICKSHFHVSCIKKTNNPRTFVFLLKSSVRKQSLAITIFYHKLYHKSKSLFSLPQKIKVKCSKPNAIQNKPKHYLTILSHVYHWSDIYFTSTTHVKKLHPYFTTHVNKHALREEMIENTIFRKIWFCSFYGAAGRGTP